MFRQGGIIEPSVRRDAGTRFLPYVDEFMMAFHFLESSSPPFGVGALLGFAHKAPTFGRNKMSIEMRLSLS